MFEIDPVEDLQAAVEGDDPRALFPVGYESHWFLMVDLTDPAGAPASAWTYGFGDDDYVRAFSSLAALFRSCAERAEAPDLPQDRAPFEGASRYQQFESAFRDGYFTSIVDRHFAGSSTGGRTAVDVMDRDAWPVAWRRAEQVTVGEPAPGGATHTAAAFEDALSADGGLRGRLRGQLTWGNSPNDGILLRLTDGSGSIPLFAPHDRLPAGWNKASAVEVEVRGNGPIPLAPSEGPLAGAAYDSVAAALAGDDEVERAAFNREAAAYHQSLADFAARVPHVEAMVVLGI